MMVDTTTYQPQQNTPLLRRMKEPRTTYASLPRATKRFLAGSTVTLFATMLLLAYLTPLFYMGFTAFKTENMISDPTAPLYPASPASIEYDGKEVEIYQVPIDNEVRSLALVTPGRQQSTFVDPANLDAGPIEWTGNWRTLDQAYQFDPRTENFSIAWDTMDFLTLLRNTIAIAVIGVVGTLISSTLVAYGLSRFQIPFKRTIFVVLVATIILPGFVKLIPTYALFYRIGWVGTWLPLVVPHFFANAYNVFLLRQYFLTIPKELDEAAMIDGAGPLRTFWSVFLPQVKPALMAVALFHFFFAWNDFFEPLVYLSARRDLQPISVGLTLFKSAYDSQPHLIQAGALLGLAIPLVVFFLAQRVFLKGIDLSGVQK
jgi:multiple sugar transport system permease protein